MKRRFHLDDISEFFQGFLQILIVFSIIIPIFTLCIATIEFFFSEQTFKRIYIHRIKFFAALIVFGIFYVLSLAAYYFCSLLTLTLAEKINQARLKSFSYQKPILFNQLSETLGDVDSYIGMFFIGNWLIGVISYFLFAFNVAYPFIYITIVQASFIFGFYVSILHQHKDLGRWSFYQVRAFIFPYLILLFPLIVGGALAIFSMNWLILKIFAFFNIAATELLAQVPLLAQLPPWGAAFDSMINCILWSSGISFILIWIIPIFMRKDYVSIIVIILAVLAPVVTNIIVESIKPINIFLVNFSRIPTPVSSVFLVLLVDKGYGLLQSFIRPGLTCPKCGNSMPLSDNYCNVCGNPSSKHE